MPKKTKHEVVYSKGMKLAHCGICQHYNSRNRSCAIVEGSIDASMWCMRFKKREKAK